MTHPTLRTLSALALAALLPACTMTGDDAPERAIRIDTLPGGVVHVRNPAPARDSASIEHARLVATIGEVEGEDAYILGQVYAVSVGPDRRIYVVDAQAHEVRVFDLDGRHVRTLGREGEGPGELANPMALAWSPEAHLWVMDPRNQRYTVFDTAGALVGTHPRNVNGYGLDWNMGFDAEGRFNEQAFRMIPGERRSERVLLRSPVTQEGLGVTDTLPLPPYEQEFYRVDFTGGSMSFGIPFQPQQVWRLDGRGGFWVGTSDAFTFTHVDAAGDTTRIVEVAHTPEPVGEQEMADARAELEAQIERMPDPAAGRRQVDFSRIPAVKPAWQNFLVSDEGELWVAQPVTPERAGTGPTVFDVFDREGRYLRTVEAPVPPRWQLSVGRGHIVGVTRDELGVARVVVARAGSGGEPPDPR